MKATSALLLGGGRSSSANQIHGKLRVMPGGYLGDDTGYRRVILNHDFPLFNLWAFDEPEARRGLEATARAGFQGSRVMHRIVGEWDKTTTNPSNYWYQREVTPEIFRAVRKQAIGYAKQLGLRLVLTAGFRYGYSSSTEQDQYSWMDEMTGLIRDDGNAEVILWVESLGNEVDSNRPELSSNVSEAMRQAKQLQAIIRRNLGCLVSNGSFGQESTVVDPQYPNEGTLLTSADGADLLDIHNQRCTDQVKHSHTMWLATHYQGQDRRPISEGETGGENAPYQQYQAGGDVSTCANNDPHYLLATVGIQQMTGQAVCYLNGPGVRRWYPLDSTLFFSTLPRALEPIPQDIVTWRDENNPSWFIKGKEFVIVTLAAYGQLAHPPHPVKSAVFYGMSGPEGDSVVGGIPVAPFGWTGGIVRGEFA